MRALWPTLPFLGLLVLTTLSTSLVVPFMGYFIVEGLGKDPWMIGLYSSLSILTSVGFNRMFATRLDRGDSAFPLIGIAGAAFLVANLSIVILPNFTVLMTIGVFGFGLSGSATSTLFSLGRQVAQDAGVKAQDFNAYMRAMTSTAWMVGPAVAFVLADLLGPRAVFEAALMMSVVWLLLWPRVLARDAHLTPKEVSAQDSAGAARGMVWAVTACFLISFGHSLAFNSLPLFYVREVGLPTFAPGVAFSVKTGVEVVAILGTSFLMSKYGLRPLLIGVAILAMGTTQVLASVTSFHQMLFGAALEGFYYGLYASLGLSFVQSFAGGRMAQATATYWNMIKIAGLTAGPIAGLIAQYHSFHMVVQLSGLGAGLGLCVLLLMPAQAPAPKNT